MNESKNIGTIKEMIRTVNELSLDKKFEFSNGSDRMNEFTRALYGTSLIYTAGVLLDYDKKERILNEYHKFPDVLAFIPARFDGIKSGDEYKVIISGEYNWDVIFEYPNVEHETEIGWTINLYCHTAVEQIPIEIIINK